MCRKRSMQDTIASIRSVWWPVVRESGVLKNTRGGGLVKVCLQELG